MKLALIGGGSVRSPEFVRGALVFARDLDLRELWLMDIDPARLAAMTPLCQEIARRADAPFSIHSTTSLDDALRDASLVVTTIRVGFERGRVLDERIALRRGILGQETTGPGGFAMAMRNIPALIEIAQRTAVLAPRAWTFNFTNPAGLVAQALRAAGYPRVIGICDSANTAQYEVAHWMERPVNEVKTEVFGLNHLSWTRSATIDGREVLPGLLANDAFINDTHLRFFSADLVRRIGMFLNEYLFYYYYRDVAVERIQAEELTRGEEVEMLNQQLFPKLRELPPDEALRVYDAYQRRRTASYMAYAESDEALREERLHPTEETQLAHHAQAEVGGYAGVALRTGLALTQDRPLRIALNVPNNGAIHGFAPDDVVEITCNVDARGVQPIAIGDVPEAQYLLMRAVKRYERLAVKAILQRDRWLGIEALAAHPLVGSYALAEQLLADYMDAHRDTIGEWA